MLPFFKNHARFLLFGFALTFFCNFGQTFFIGIYSPDIREAFNLSSGAFGTLYGVATLASAASLVWIGKLIDEVDLRYYTMSVFCVMVLACVLMWQAQSLWVVGLALALLRLSGQGLMPHISSTSMARYFTKGRGRAISIGQMGGSIGHMVFPPVAVTLVAAVGWQNSWGVYGLFMACIALPLAMYLLKGHSQRHQNWEAEVTLAEAESGQSSRMQQSVRKQVLTDKRFYMIIPGLMSLPLFATAFFFFPDMLLQAKGWSEVTYAWSFSFYAGAMVVCSLLGGGLVDKVGNSFSLLPFTALPFIGALLLAIMGSHEAFLPIVLGLIGASIGFVSVVTTSIWAEIYGPRIIGAVRAIVTAIMVFSTAATPAVLGSLYDMGVSLEASYIGFIVYIILGSGLHGLLWYQQQKQTA